MSKSLLSSLGAMYEQLYWRELRANHPRAPKKKLRAIFEAYSGLACHLSSRDVAVLCQLPDEKIAEFGAQAKRRQDEQIAEEYEL